MADDFIPAFDPTRKRTKPKSKAKPAEVPAESAAAAAPADAVAEPTSNFEENLESTTYSYEFLLSRVFDLVNQSKPEGRGKFRVPPPEAFRVGTVRTLWANFAEICKCMNRDPQHVMTFVTIELGTTANLDANNRLVIRGTYMPKQLTRIVKRYIEEYVQCHSCEGRETVLSKQQRLYFVQCISPVCGSTRSVAPLNKGYMHQLRRQRKP